MCHIPYTIMVGSVLLRPSELSEALQLKLTPRSIISMGRRKKKRRLPEEASMNEESLCLQASLPSFDGGP